MSDNATKNGSNTNAPKNPGNFANDPQRAAEAGRQGGMAAQRNGNAHRLTDAERSRGGSNSGGNFKHDPDRASEAGQTGGSSRS